MQEKVENGTVEHQRKVNQHHIHLAEERRRKNEEMSRRERGQQMHEAELDAQVPFCP